MKLLYFSPVPWDSYSQRPHFFVQHFLNRGGEVAWVDPYPTRFPVPGDLARVRAQSRLPTPRPPNLEVISLRAVPIEPLAIGRWLTRTFLWKRLAASLGPGAPGTSLVIGVGRPSELALAALETLDHAGSFYDAMDDFPEFYQGRSKQHVQASEQKITSAVDVVLTSSSGLWRKFESLGAKRRLVQNAYDMLALPDALATANGHPVFGYVGCIGGWFDWPIVARLAQAHPDAEVRLVGPCVSAPPRDLSGNVTFFPACAHAEAVGHLRGFSVGLIPFTRTALTDSVDPIKYYGYRGMGLPVLTTAFGDMAHRGEPDGTFFLDDEKGLDWAAAAALGARPEPEVVRGFRRDNDWQRRFDEAGLFERALPW